MAALALLLMDIATRRITLSPGLWARAFAWRRAAPAGRPLQAETPLARLWERKQLAEHELQRKAERPEVGGAPQAAAVMQLLRIHRRQVKRGRTA